MYGKTKNIVSRSRWACSATLDTPRDLDPSTDGLSGTFIQALLDSNRDGANKDRSLRLGWLIPANDGSLFFLTERYNFDGHGSNRIDLRTVSTDQFGAPDAEEPFFSYV